MNTDMTDMTEPKTAPFDATASLQKAIDGLPDDWAAAPLVNSAPLRLSFSGRGRDYLSLWLTNWILTIVTLGIYSAWAKVRRLQYIHQNTQLGGYAFGFHAAPTKILIGRIIGLVLIGISHWSGQINEKTAGASSVVFLLVFPWLYRAAIRFYSRHSSYRNVRFRFIATNRETYWLFFTSILWVVLSAGFAFPYVVYRLRRYRVNHTRWGNNAFEFTSSAGAFFGIYILNIVVTLVVMGGLTALLVGFGAHWFKGMDKEIADVMNEKDQFKLMIAGALYFLFIYIVYMIGRVLTQDLIFKESWSHISINKSRFNCDLSIPHLYFIRMGCFLASFATLGFFIPFAHMIIAKRRIESVTFTPAHDFDVMQATLDDDTTRAAEVADMLDIDVGW